MLPLLAKIAWRSQSRLATWTAIGSLAIGVAAAASVRMLATDFQKRVREDAREWLGADVAVHTKDEVVEVPQSGAAASTVVTECITMARSKNAADPLIVSLKAVDPAVYPLYGAVEVTPQRALQDILGRDGALVSRGVMERLRVDPGGTIDVGSGTLRVTAVVESEPDRYAGMPNAFERVIVSRTSFDRIYHAGFSPSLTHRVLFRGWPDERALREAFPGAEITSYRDADPSAVAALELASTFLDFIAICAFGLAMIAFSASAHLRMEERMDTIAILRSLGATRRKWIGAFVLESLILASAGALLGIALIRPVTALASSVNLPVRIRAGFDPAIALQLTGWSVAVAVVSCWAPFQAVSSAPVIAIFRRKVESRRTPVLASLAIIAGATAASGKALIAAAMFAILLAILVATTQAAFRAIGRVAPGSVARVSVRNLNRNRFRSGLTLGVLMAGGTLLVAIRAGQGRVTDELLASVPGVGKHNLFVVGSSQASFDRLMAKLKSHPAVRGNAVAVPLAWLRLHEIDGHPNRSGKQMWFATCGDQAEGAVSVSQDRARQLGIKAGSRLTFATAMGEIQATAEVVRSPNAVEDVVYGFVLPCSALESTPLFYYGGVRVEPPEQVGSVRRWLAEQEPSAGTLSALELRQISERTASDAIGMLRTLSGLALAGGVVLLALLVAATQPARWSDLAILRVLGARRWKMVGMLAIEFSLLSLAAIAGGTLAGSVLTSLALSTFLKRVTFEFSIAWGESLGLFAVWTVAGIVSCLPALRRRPLQVLRED